ncbi:protein of unknown function [Cupriavidus taiwanensis]|nr:protein of unknown function [Cupriavidus taiwanensis]
MQLRHIVDASPQDFGGMQFGDGGFFSRETTPHVLAEVVIHHRAQGHRLCLDIGELEPGVLEVPDRLPEGLAVLDVLDGLLQQALELGGSGDGDDEAFLGQVVHQVAEALILLAEQVASRHPDVVEEQFGGVLGVHADLLQLAAAAEALAIGFDHDQADALGAGRRVGLAHHHHHVGDEAVRDEGLAAVDDPFVAIPHCSGTAGFHVRAATRLGNGNGQHGLARADAGQPRLLLRFGTQPDDVRRNDIGVKPEGNTAADIGHFLGDDGRVPEVAASTAVFHRQPRAQQAFAASLDPGRAVYDTVLPPLLLARQAFTLQEPADRGAELLMIFTIDTTNDLHEDSPLFGVGWRRPAEISARSAVSQ